MAARQAAQTVPLVSRNTLLDQNQHAGSGRDKERKERPPTGRSFVTPWQRATVLVARRAAYIPSGRPLTFTGGGGGATYRGRDVRAYSRLRPPARRRLIGAEREELSLSRSAASFCETVDSQKSNIAIQDSSLLSIVATTRGSERSSPMTATRAARCSSNPEQRADVCSAVSSSSLSAQRWHCAVGSLPAILKRYRPKHPWPVNICVSRKVTGWAASAVAAHPVRENRADRLDGTEAGRRVRQTTRPCQHGPPRLKPLRFHYTFARAPFPPRAEVATPPVIGSERLRLQVQGWRPGEQARRIEGDGAVSSDRPDRDRALRTSQRGDVLAGQGVAPYGSAV
ncbi:uncharacterized protein LOC134200079 [Bombyx mori]|uniref:uncharacterized protein LOC134200079 n=1 Tax=Bombyx mori TaxID=7091 RepID=UPI002ED1BEA3